MVAMFAGCKTSADVTSSATKKTDENVIRPLPETLDITALDNCTVAISFEKGDVYVDDSGKMMMKAKVYSYEVFDMVDIAALAEGSLIARRGETVKVEKIERLDSGLVRINGGEENGGFDLFSNDDTVYYEIGVNDYKAYYELGEAVLPVSTEFVYYDNSDLEADAKKYYPGDFVTDAGIEYNFTQYNTSIVIENGAVIEMSKVYTP